MLPHDRSWVLPVTAVFAILILLIVVAPAIAIMDGVVSVGVLLAAAATAVALIALTQPAGEFRRLGELWKPIAPIALLPCIWMLVQIVPVPDWLAHPAWMSASFALDRPITGTISLDIGSTLLALGRYSLVLAIAIVATAVALDRQRAQAILLLLTAAAVSISAGLVGLDLAALHFATIDLSAQRAQMLTIAVIGLVLSCANAIRAYATYRQRRASGGAGDSSTTIHAAASIVGMVVCLAAIGANTVLLLAAASGSIVLIGIAAIHRSRIGPWGLSGIAAAATVGVIAVLAVSPMDRAADLTLALSSQHRASVATAERILSDAKWVGTGAGTFDALLPIYRDVDDAELDAAPTAAASIAIEMGRPFLWTLVILALIGAASLFRRALMRGREYAYAGTGAASIFAVLVSSFANTGILGVAASALASMVFGLALAQSRSWSV